MSTEDIALTTHIERIFPSVCRIISNGNTNITGHYSMWPSNTRLTSGYFRHYVYQSKFFNITRLGGAICIRQLGHNWFRFACRLFWTNQLSRLMLNCCQLYLCNQQFIFQLNVLNFRSLCYSLISKPIPVSYNIVKSVFDNIFYGSSSCNLWSVIIKYFVYCEVWVAYPCLGNNTTRHQTRCAVISLWSFESYRLVGEHVFDMIFIQTARFVRPTWGPHGVDSVYITTLRSIHIKKDKDHSRYT